MPVKQAVKRVFGNLIVKFANSNNSKAGRGVLNVAGKIKCSEPTMLGASGETTTATR